MQELYREALDAMLAAARIEGQITDAVFARICEDHLIRPDNLAWRFREVEGRDYREYRPSPSQPCAQCRRPAEPAGSQRRPAFSGLRIAPAA